MEWKRNNIAVVLAVLTASLFSSCEENEDFINLDDKEEEIVTRKPKLYDIDGNEYSTDLVAGREWMVENLKTSKYKDGTPIPNVSDPGEWAVLNSGAFAWYNNDQKNEEKLGKLYNWHAINCCNICPEGWSVPTKEEFQVVLKHYQFRFWYNTTLKLRNSNTSKIVSKTEWSDFNSMGAERRNRDGKFHTVLNYDGIDRFAFTGFWSSEVYNEEEAYIVYAYAPKNRLISAKLELSIQPKKTGISVKCIKDL